MSQKYNFEKGIIVGCDAKMEYLLPYFFLNLRLNSNLPITFFDFGMSLMGRRFCEKRGRVLDIKKSLWQSQDFSYKEINRHAWFKKPLAFKEAPYALNLWLDLDCKILKPIDGIFDALTNDKWIAIHEENPQHPNWNGFNSGVVVFPKNSPFISLWIQACKIHAKHLNGDQDVLNIILKNQYSKVAQLSHIWNHLYLKIEPHNLTQSHIIHHFGPFKMLLQKEYLALEGTQNLDVFQAPVLEY